MTAHRILICGTIAAYLGRAGVDITAVDSNPAQVGPVREQGMSIAGPIENFIQLFTAQAPDDVAGAWNTVIYRFHANSF